MNFVDKDGTTKVYIPVHPCHSDLGLTNYRTDHEGSLKLNLKPLHPLCTIKCFTRAAGRVTVNSESGVVGVMGH